MHIPGPLVIIILAAILWMVAFNHIHPNYKEVKYEDLLAMGKFKTGDILLFKALDNWNAPVLASYFGHIGIIYVDPDDPTRTPYLFEAANPTDMVLEDQHNEAGIFFSKLVDRIKRYQGYTYLKELAVPIHPDKIREFKEFMHFCVDKMYYNINVFSNGLRKGLFGERLNLGTNCGEIVFLSLLKLGLLPQEYYQKNVFHHLRWMCSIQDLTDNRYLEPVKITYAPF